MSVISSQRRRFRCSKSRESRPRRLPATSMTSPPHEPMNIDIKRQRESQHAFKIRILGVCSSAQQCAAWWRSYTSVLDAGRTQNYIDEWGQWHQADQETPRLRPVTSCRGSGRHGRLMAGPTQHLSHSITSLRISADPMFSQLQVLASLYHPTRRSP